MKAPSEVEALREQLLALPAPEALQAAEQDATAALARLNEATFEFDEHAAAKSNLFTFLRAHPVFRGCVDGRFFRESHTRTEVLTAGILRAQARIGALQKGYHGLRKEVTDLLAKTAPIAEVLAAPGGKAQVKREAVQFLAGAEYVELSTLRKVFGRAGHVPTVDLLAGLDKAYREAEAAGDDARILHLDNAFDDTDWLLGGVPTEVARLLAAHGLAHLHPRGKDKALTEAATPSELLVAVNRVQAELERLWKPGGLEAERAGLSTVHARVQRHLQLKTRGLAAFEHLQNLSALNVDAGITTPRMRAAMERLRARESNLARLRSEHDTAQRRASEAEAQAQEAAAELARLEDLFLRPEDAHEDVPESTLSSAAVMFQRAEVETAQAEALKRAEVARVAAAALHEEEEAFSTSALLARAAKDAAKSSDGIDPAVALDAGLKARAVAFLKCHPLLADLAPSRLFGNVPGEDIIDALEKARARVEKVRVREAGAGKLKPTVEAYVEAAHALSVVRQMKVTRQWHPKKEGMQRDLDAADARWAAQQRGVVAQVIHAIEHGTQRLSSSALKARLDAFLASPAGQAADLPTQELLRGYRDELAVWANRRDLKNRFVAFLEEADWEMGHLVPRASRLKAANHAPARAFEAVFASILEELEAIARGEVEDALVTFRDQLRARAELKARTAEAEKEARALRARLAENESAVGKALDAALGSLRALTAALAEKTEAVDRASAGVLAAEADGEFARLTEALKEAEDQLEELADKEDPSEAALATAHALATTRREARDARATALGLPEKGQVLAKASQAREEAARAQQDKLEFVLLLNTRAQRLAAIRSAERAQADAESVAPLADARSELAGRPLLEDLVPDGSGRWLTALGIASTDDAAELDRRLGEAARRLEALHAGQSLDPGRLGGELQQLGRRLRNLVATRELGKLGAKLRLLEALKVKGQDARAAAAQKALGLRAYFRTGHNSAAGFVALLKAARTHHAGDATTLAQLDRLLGQMEPLSERTPVKKEVLAFFERHKDLLGGLQPRTRWYDVRTAHAPFLSLHEALQTLSEELERLPELSADLAQLGERIVRRAELKKEIDGLKKRADEGRAKLQAAHTQAKALFDSVEAEVVAATAKRERLLGEINALASERIPAALVERERLAAALQEAVDELQALSEEDDDEGREDDAPSPLEARRAELRVTVRAREDGLAAQRATLAKLDQLLEATQEAVRTVDLGLVELLEIQVLATERADEIQAARDRLEEAFRVHKAVKSVALYLRTVDQVRDTLRTLADGLRAAPYEADALASVNVLLAIHVGVRAGVDLGFAELAGRVRVVLAVSGTLAVTESRKVEFGHRVTVMLQAEAAAKAGVRTDVGLVPPSLLPTPEVLLKASVTAGCTLYDAYHCALYDSGEHFLEATTQAIARRLTYLSQWRHGGSGSLDEQAALALTADGLSEERKAWIRRGLEKVPAPATLHVRKKDWGLTAHASASINLGGKEGGDTEFVALGGSQRSGDYALALTPPGATAEVSVGHLYEQVLYFKSSDGDPLPPGPDSLSSWSDDPSFGSACAPTGLEYRTAVFHRFSRAGESTKSFEYLQVQTRLNAGLLSSGKNRLQRALRAPGIRAGGAEPRLKEALERLKLARAFTERERLDATSKLHEHRAYWLAPGLFKDLMAEDGDVFASGTHGFRPRGTRKNPTELDLVQLQVGTRMAVIRGMDAHALGKLDASSEAGKAVMDRPNGFVRLVGQKRPYVTVGGLLDWHTVFTPEVVRAVEVFQVEFAANIGIEVLPFLAVEVGAGLQATFESALFEVLGLETFRYLKTLYAGPLGGPHWAELLELHQDELYFLCASVTDIDSGPFADVAHDVLTGTPEESRAALAFGAWCARAFQRTHRNPFAEGDGAPLTAELFRERLVAMLRSHGGAASGTGPRRPRGPLSAPQLDRLQSSRRPKLQGDGVVQGWADAAAQRLRAELERYPAHWADAASVPPCFGQLAANAASPGFVRTFTPDVGVAFERVRHPPATHLPSRAAVERALASATRNLPGDAGPGLPEDVGRALDAWHAAPHAVRTTDWDAAELERNLTTDPYLESLGRRDERRERGEETVAAFADKKLAPALAQLAALQRAVDGWRAREGRLHGLDRPADAGPPTLSENQVGTLFRDLLSSQPLPDWEDIVPPNAFGGRAARRGDLASRDFAAEHAALDERRRTLDPRAAAASTRAAPAEDLSLYRLLADLTVERPVPELEEAHALRACLSLRDESRTLAGLLVPSPPAAAGKGRAHAALRDKLTTLERQLDAAGEGAERSAVACRQRGEWTALRDGLWHALYDWAKRVDLDEAQRAAHRKSLRDSVDSHEAELGKAEARARERLESLQSWEGYSALLTRDGLSLGRLLAACRHHERRKAYVAARGVSSPLDAREAARYSALATALESLRRDGAAGRVDAPPAPSGVLAALRAREAWLSSVDAALSSFLGVPGFTLPAGADEAAVEAKLLTGFRTTYARAKATARTPFDIPGARAWDTLKGEGRSFFSFDSSATTALGKRLGENEKARHALLQSWEKAEVMTDEGELGRRAQLNAGGLGAWLRESEAYQHMLRERCGVGMDVLGGVCAWSTGKTAEGSQRMPVVVAQVELPALREIIRCEVALLALSARAALVRLHAALHDVELLTGAHAQLVPAEGNTRPAALLLHLQHALHRDVTRAPGAGGAPAETAAHLEAWWSWGQRLAGRWDAARPGTEAPRAPLPERPGTRRLLYFCANTFDVVERALEAPLAQLRLSLLGGAADLVDALALSALEYRDGMVDRVEMGEELRKYLEPSRERYAYVGMVHSVRQQRMPGAPIYAVKTSDERPLLQRVETAVRKQLVETVSEKVDPKAGAVVEAVTGHDEEVDTSGQAKVVSRGMRDYRVRQQETDEGAARTAADLRGPVVERLRYRVNERFRRRPTAPAPARATP